MAYNRAEIPPPKKVSYRLRLLLEYHGVGKTELARAVGVTPAAVTQWTKGTSAISPVKGKAIAKFLGEDFDFVMGLEDRGSEGVGLVASRIGGERLKKLAALDPEEYSAFLAVIDDYLEAKKTK